MSPKFQIYFFKITSLGLKLTPEWYFVNGVPTVQIYCDGQIKWGHEKSMAGSPNHKSTGRDCVFGVQVAPVQWVSEDKIIP